MPDSHIRARPSSSTEAVERAMVVDAAWPVKPSQPPEGQPPHGPFLACGVGVLEGADGARSRCAREEGTSTRCECGQHTFLLSSSSFSGPRREQQQQQQQKQDVGSENRPPPLPLPMQQQQQQHLTEDIENISRSMVQAMSVAARGDPKGTPDGGMAATFSSSSSSSSNPQQQPPPSQQQQQQGQQGQGQGYGKRPSLPGGSGSGSDLPLDRIVVEPNGDMVLVEPSVVCDACPACDDVCCLAACRGCAEKRARLVARGEMCLLDAQGRRLLIRESSSSGGSGPAGCVPRIGKPRTPSSGAAASGAGASAASACYTLCEIRRHRTLGSCWLVAKGQVYDATRYLSSHPAGAIAIARKAGGADCSEDLEFHSGKAQKLWKHMRIGTVVACPSEALKPAHGLGPGPERLRRGGARAGAAGAGAYAQRHRREESASLVGSSCSIM
jgi:hypothetical protein